MARAATSVFPVTAVARSLGDTIQRFYRLSHDRLLNASGDTSPEQFATSVGPSLHSVAWQLWHAARWDDFFAAHLQNDFGGEPSGQVWDRQDLAHRWGLVAGTMGQRDAGTGMDDAAADQMRFPEQSDVIGYAGEAFAFARSAIAAIPAGRLTAVAKDDADGDTYLDNILIYYEHLNRHLGMIEAIRGLL